MTHKPKLGPKVGIQAAGPERASHAPGEGLRILLVEDHQRTRLALVHLLTHRNLSVRAASTLAEARALARTHSFDLLITDIGLPDGTGYDLIGELQKTTDLKGIALTGYGADQDIKRIRESGFIAHLIKSVPIRALEEVLAKVSKEMASARYK